MSENLQNNVLVTVPLEIGNRHLDVNYFAYLKKQPLSLPAQAFLRVFMKWCPVSGPFKESAAFSFQQRLSTSDRITCETFMNPGRFFTLYLRESQRASDTPLPRDRGSIITASPSAPCL